MSINTDNFDDVDEPDTPASSPYVPERTDNAKPTVADRDPRHPARYDQPEPRDVGAPSAHDLAAENLLDMDSRTVPKHLRGIGKKLRILVQRDLGDRAAVGLDRYGQTLQPGNGRDTLIDIYQEAVDALAYAEAFLYEARDSTEEDAAKALVTVHRQAVLSTRALLAHRNGEIEVPSGNTTAPAAGDSGTE